MKFGNRKNGYYTINCDKCSGGQMVSTTTILKTIGNDNLNQYRIKLGAIIQLKYQPLVNSIPSAEEIVKLNKLYIEEQNAIFNRGKEKHSFIEAYFKTGKLPSHTEDGYYKAFKSFINDYDIDPIYIEKELHSCKYKIAGTGDMGARIKKKTDKDWKIAQIDWKTQEIKPQYKDKPPMIWPTTGLQLSNYAHMAVEQGILPKFDSLLGIAFGSNGKYLVKECNDDFSTFLAVNELYSWVKQVKN